MPDGLIHRGGGIGVNMMFGWRSESRAVTARQLDSSTAPDFDIIATFECPPAARRMVE